MENKNLNDVTPAVDYSKELEQLTISAGKYNKINAQQNETVKALNEIEAKRAELKKSKNNEALNKYNEEVSQKLNALFEDKAEASTLLPSAKADFKAALKAVKAGQKASLNALKDKHRKMLEEFEAKQADDFEKYIASCPTKQEVNDNVARLKIEQETALAELKANQEAKLAAMDSSNEEAVLALKKKQQNEIAEVLYAQKAEMTKTKNSGVSQFQLQKIKYQQYLDYSKYEQELQYEEYQLELVHKAEIEKALGITKDESGDQDVEKGNPIAVWFHQFFRDIKVNVSEKPSIIFGLLVILPGILFGFCINQFINVSTGFTDNVTYVGIVIFAFELISMINIVNGFGMCNQRRLKSVVSATIVGIVSIALSLTWIISLQSSEFHAGKYAGQATSTILIMIICIVANLVGIIGGYFTFDKHYVKDVKR
ncbi:MAG: hypothetical protein K6G28_03815 [Acholeplasmatales bacterium]|nr:hypothetical protein [Acholeplasmatales bacterium]